jgi:hypothetical protein
MYVPALGSGAASRTRGTAMPLHFVEIRFTYEIYLGASNRTQVPSRIVPFVPRLTNRGLLAVTQFAERWVMSDWNVVGLDGVVYKASPAVRIILARAAR